MAGRAQNPYKGQLQKNTVTFGTATITTATITTANITTSAPATLDLSSKQALTGNSTGIVFADYAASLPGNVDNGALFGMISNSTGVALFINSTGTTHKYLQVTTKFPT